MDRRGFLGMLGGAALAVYLRLAPEKVAEVAAEGTVPVVGLGGFIARADDNPIRWDGNACIVGGGGTTEPLTWEKLQEHYEELKRQDEEIRNRPERVWVWTKREGSDPRGWEGEVMVFRGGVVEADRNVVDPLSAAGRRRMMAWFDGEEA